jgi:hypothetical protein
MQAERRTLSMWPAPACNHGKDAVRRTLSIAFEIVGLLSFAAAGCATPEKVTLTSSGTPNYARLHVVYDVSSDAASFDQPPSVRTVSQEDEAAPHLPAGRVRLELQYPYPGLHPAFARATLRILPTSSDPPLRGAAATKAGSNASKSKDGSRSQAEEVLVIALPKTELDSLLKDLARDDYFKRTDIASGQSNLAVTYNRSTIEKGWNREPRLDALIQMLQQHGTPAVEAPTK